ncbi:MAG TPA: hypothetical protein PLH92_02110 [Mycobacterium sp.]|nr:hypothetical protein [Mycobacterium sp.]HQC75497.1 hypothetical protein [Mycobacterium sp.]
MNTRTKFNSALGALALAVAAIPLTSIASPAVSQAEDNCDFNYFLNTITNQCQFCDTAVMYWNYDANVCVPIDETPYVDPILGPVGPVGVGPDPVLGPVGPVGVGGLGPVAGPVGPVGVGGLGPVAGPVGPVGIGRR